MVQKISLDEKYGAVNDHWHPRIIAELNDSHVKLVKVLGEFTWHHHDQEDELFLVIKGKLRIQMADHEEILEAGELIVIPHGIEHCPVADEEAWLLLLEPKGTRNTGNVKDERTIDAEWI